MSAQAPPTDKPAEPTTEQLYSEEPLTSTVRPDTMAVITVRVIKSFEYRTVRSHVLRDVDLTATTAPALLARVRALVQTDPAFRTLRSVAKDLDTIKVYTHAHGAKSMNLVINFEHDEDWILRDENKSLRDAGVENETELSVFNMAAYEAYKAHPEEKW